MSAPISTAGQLRGFLADVLTDLRAKRMTPDEANAIAKVAGEITRSLAVEVQTAIHAGVKQPVPGSMVIATPVVESEASAQLPQTASVNEVPAQPNPKKGLDCPPEQQAPRVPTSIAVMEQRENEKIWCDQCDARVTPGQAVSCKSPHCKAKAAA